MGVGTDLCEAHLFPRWVIRYNEAGNSRERVFVRETGEGVD